jgi:AraC family transcriptional activator of pobA
VLAADEPVQQVMMQIAAEFENRRPARALVLRGLCTALLGLTARALAPGDPVAVDMAGSHLFHRFEALVDAHHLDQWAVADYAQALRVSPTHLSRVVRAATLGFAEPAHFSRVFSRAEGLSPRAFRAHMARIGQAAAQPDPTIPPAAAQG